MGWKWIYIGYKISFWWNEIPVDKDLKGSKINNKATTWMAFRWLQINQNNALKENANTKKMIFLNNAKS